MKPTPSTENSAEEIMEYPATGQCNQFPFKPYLIICCLNEFLQPDLILPLKDIMVFINIQPKYVVSAVLHLMV